MSDAFFALAASIRPELHRYCARMLGSTADGEDVVQEALTRAYLAREQLTELPALRHWLFRAAHNCAIDLLRRRKVPIETEPEPVDDPEDRLARQQALAAAVSRFGVLPTSQRSAVILKDVLGHSLDEVAALLGLGVPAVKALLHRGRVRLREAPPDAPTTDAPPPDLVRYVTLFNARDWDGVRDLLAEDVRLELVDKARKRGRAEVGTYLTNYDSIAGWSFALCMLDGQPALRGEQPGRSPWFVVLAIEDGHVQSIRDYRYVPYIAQDASPAR